MDVVGHDAHRVQFESLPIPVLAAGENQVSLFGGELALVLTEGDEVSVSAQLPVRQTACVDVERVPDGGGRCRRGRGRRAACPTRW